MTLFATLLAGKEISHFINNIHDEFVRAIQLRSLVYSINALTKNGQEDSEKEINNEQDIGEEVELRHKRICFIDLIKLTLPDHTNEERAKWFKDIKIRLQISPKQEVPKYSIESKETEEENAEPKKIPGAVVKHTDHLPYPFVVP